MKRIENMRGNMEESFEKRKWEEARTSVCEHRKRI